MKSAVRHAFEEELAVGMLLYRQNRERDAMTHFENAHVLGQQYVVPHVRSHWWMLKVAAKQRSLSAVMGQILRIVLGIIGSATGIIPYGNTGGSDISVFQSRPIDEKLRKRMSDE